MLLDDRIGHQQRLRGKVHCAVVSSAVEPRAGVCCVVTCCAAEWRYVQCAQILNFSCFSLLNNVIHVHFNTARPLPSPISQVLQQQHTAQYAGNAASSSGGRGRVATQPRPQSSHSGHHQQTVQRSGGWSKGVVWTPSHLAAPTAVNQRANDLPKHLMPRAPIGIIQRFPAEYLMVHGSMFYVILS